MTRPILSSKQIEIIIRRLCFQLIENHGNFENTALLGLQPRGIYLAERLQEQLIEIVGHSNILLGNLDATFFRDDFRRKSNPLIPNRTEIDFIIEDKKVVLIDDVLFTGRTIRAGMDAMQAYGRPEKVELLVLVDRRYSRHLPIEPNYVGTVVDTTFNERVEAKWKKTDGKDQVVLYVNEQ